VLAYLVAAALGALVGLAELASRYRDRPAVLVSVPSAWFYALLNAAASVTALFLVISFGWTFGTANPDARTVLRVIVASLTALAILRSSLFTVRVGDADVAVGPSTVLTTLLHIADRGVDRRRAADRSRQVTKIMAGVSFERARLALPAFCLALLQNVSPEEQHDLGIAVDALAGSSMSDTQKAYALGLLLMNLAGPDVLSDAVTALRAEIAAGAASGAEATGEARTADPSAA
jgi:hypothetical protein